MPFIKGNFSHNVVACRWLAECVYVVASNARTDHELENDNEMKQHTELTPKTLHNKNTLKRVQKQ